MSKIRVGIVGFGLMGQLYAEYVSRCPDAQITAIADLDKESLAKARRERGWQTYEDYLRMYDANVIDLAIITLPDFLHREAVVKAAERRLNILVEKPFATSTADAEAMAAAVEKAGVKCMVEFFNRWSPPFFQAKKRVAANELGEIVSFAIELNDRLWVPTKMLKWAARSSPAWFLMSHTADLAFWILPERPRAVQARGVKKLLAGQGIDTYDLIEAFLEYPDGSTGRLSSSWVLPDGMPMVYELTMRIVGSKAAIDIDTSDQEVHLISHENLQHPITAWGEVLGYHVGHPYTMLRAFLDAVREGREPPITHQEGVRNTRFLSAVHESLSTGKTIQL